MRRLEPQNTLFGGYTLPRIRTYRIPYIGSKNAIAGQLIEAIINNVGGLSESRFVDGFCGGGAITYGVLQTKLFSSILANDLHEDMILLHQNLKNLDLNFVAKTPCILAKNDEVLSKYPFVKTIDEIEDKYKMIFKIVYSFGNNCITNLFGGDVIYKYGVSYSLFNEPEKLAKLIADILNSNEVQNFEYKLNTISGRYNEYKRHIKMFKKQLEQLQRLELLELLEQLQQLQRLEQLQLINKSGILKFNFGSYKDIEYRSNDVVYFDPPYRGTLNNKGYNEIEFNNDEFEDFARSLKMPVFISEYQPKIKGFTPILKIEKQATLSNKGLNKQQKQRFEYLHWNEIKN